MWIRIPGKQPESLCGGMAAQKSGACLDVGLKRRIDGHQCGNRRWDGGCQPQRPRLGGCQWLRQRAIERKAIGEVDREPARILDRVEIIFHGRDGGDVHEGSDQVFPVGIGELEETGIRRTAGDCGCDGGGIGNRDMAPRRIIRHEDMRAEVPIGSFFREVGNVCQRERAGSLELG